MKLLLVFILKAIFYSIGFIINLL